MYEEIFKNREMNQRMGMGLIKLIYKRKGERVDLRNYRPITMLNTDLKILAKILANRLREVMPTIIRTNQVYGVKGKDIADTTLGIQETIRYTKTKRKEGYAISLDFEKAFDRVNHGYLFGILEKFGFGEHFIEWIKILYRGGITRIKCNGFLTECFKIKRSIRQGCPLSTLLYSLISEPLGLAITQEGEIKGIGVEGGKGKKIFQYADDTTLIVKEKESVKKAMDIVQMFCKGSGGKINQDKTVYMRFGGAIDLTDHFAFKEANEIKDPGYFNWEG